MYTFPELLKKIRESADLTQEELATVLDVSTVLIAMVETNQKDVSKKLIEKLANKLDVYPSSITPFIFSGQVDLKKISSVEKKLIELGEHLQDFLITKKAKNLRQYVS